MDNDPIRSAVPRSWENFLLPHWRAAWLAQRRSLLFTYSEHGDRHGDRQPLLEADLRAARADLSATRGWPLAHSGKPVAEILAAFHTGRRLMREMVDFQNDLIFTNPPQ